MIEIKNLYLKYIREYYALYDINLKIAPGECVGLIGDEGSGKTSLLRVLAKLEKYDKGEIYLKEINLKKIDFKNDVNLGYVALKSVFLENKSVYENLKYVLKERKYKDKEIEEKVNNALIEFNIEKLRNLKASELSPYEKHMVSLVRLSLRPLDIILIDNIFDDLNTEDISNVLEFIKKVFVEKNVTTLIASSKKELLNNICSRFIHFEYGSIIEK